MTIARFASSPLFRSFWLGVVLICGSGAPTSAQEPTTVISRLDAFAADFRDAAASTKRRLLDGLRLELEGSVIDFRGSVWSLSEATINPSTTTLPNRGRLIFEWEYGGMIARPDYQLGDAPPPVDRIRHQLGGADVATLIIIRNGAYQVYALSANPKLIDRIRTGSEVQVQVRVSGLTEDSLFGFLEGVTDQQTILRCPCGRQFPPETGFRFCPFCGKPLTSADEPESSSTQIE